MNVIMVQRSEDQMDGSILFSSSGTIIRSLCSANRSTGTSYSWTCTPEKSTAGFAANSTVASDAPRPTPVKENAAEPPSPPPVQPLTDGIGKGEAKSQPDGQIPPLYRVVDASDLYVGPRRYIGKNVEVRKVRCYYADVDDYRCITGDPLVVFSQAVEPKSARLWIEDNCDQLRKLQTAKCLFAIRFTFEADDVSEDIISGYQKRMIIRPSGGITVSYAVEQPRRRR